MFELRVAALRALRRRLARNDHLAAGAAPCGNAVSPPELTRDAPVVDVVHPVEIHLAIVVGDDGDLVGFDGGDRLFGERLDFDEPLRREARLDDSSGAIALSERDGVVLRSDEEALRGEVFDHASTRCETIKAGIGAGIRVHLVVFVNDFDLRKVVAQSGFEVVGIVRWRDFDGTSTELGLCKIVSDDRDFPIHQREQDFLAMQVRIALIFRIHGNGSIAEHGFRARGGDGNEFVRCQ